MTDTEKIVKALEQIQEQQNEFFRELQKMAVYLEEFTYQPEEEEEQGVEPVVDLVQ